MNNAPVLQNDNIVQASLENCPPAYATPRNEKRPNRLDQIEFLAYTLGLYPLLPWQKQVVEVITEQVYDPACGRLVPYYKEVVISVPRQCGKTLLMLLLVLDRFIFYPDGQDVLWAAQNLSDAGEGVFDRKFRKLLEPTAWWYEYQFRMTAALSKITLKSQLTNSYCRVISSGRASGEGSTNNMIVFDEAHAFADDAREQSLVPTLEAVPDDQFVIASTLGDAILPYFNDKVKAGQDCVERGLEDMAFFMWTKPEVCLVQPCKHGPECAHWRNPDTHLRANPGYGHSISPISITRRMNTMTEQGFRRAYLNEWTEVVEDPIIPWTYFNRATQPTQISPVGKLVLAVDGTPERDRATVCVAGGAVVEVLKVGLGFDWIFEFMEDVLKTNEDIAYVIGAHEGPCQDILDQLKPNWPVAEYYLDDMARACGRLYDNALTNELWIRAGAPGALSALRTGLNGARKGSVSRIGETWIWSRNKDESVKLDALWSVSMAHDADIRTNREGQPLIVVASEDFVEESMTDEDLREEMEAWQKIYAGNSNA